ncbi:MAG: TldD/PmbA family protein [Candidatus Bathyarchaeota archaeon]|nr:MAG: TldD/PmbA family protein [Candidatus Bathyarchaeota archaeon]
MFDLLEKAVETGLGLGASYVELRGEDGFVEYLQMDDGRVNALTQRIERGVAVRVLADGAWGFVTTGDLESLNRAVKDAYSMARAAAPTRKEQISLAETKAYQDEVEIKVERDPRHVPVEEKVKYMLDTTDVIRGFDPRITAVTFRVRTASGKKYLVTSEGTRIQSDVMLVWSYPWATGREGDRLSSARFEDASTHQGWEYMETVATPEAIGRAVGKLVKLQLEGVAAKGGSFPCVLGPRVIGVLAHEALGHLAEADLTVNSAFNGKLKSIVAAGGVTMVDDGRDPGNIGTTKYDDEGVPTSRVELIKDSVLTELLTNREYAAKLGLRLTGNARAQSYLYPPIIRMRNTFFEPGDYADEEVFEDIDFGYYCADFRGGQAQMNASFQVGIQEAYEIVEGEIGGAVTDLSISGIATDSLFKIEAISKEEFPFEAGRCGKGQEAFCASGGPNIRFGKGGITFGGVS